MAHLLLYYAPLENWRRVDVKEDHVATTWAEGVRQLVEEDFPGGRADHAGDGQPQHPRRRLAVQGVSGAEGAPAAEPASVRVHAKHGSWLNMAESEFGVLARQCLNRRLPDTGAVAAETAAWVKRRNTHAAPAQWQFTTIVIGLARCWDATAETGVPQYRDGECDVRRIWDDAVAEAMGWDKDWLSGLRKLLHREPHIRGLGYNQFG